jgi:hypothetical protein
MVKTKEKAASSKIQKGIGIRLNCDFCGGPISAKTNMRTMRDFSAVLTADLLTSKNRAEDYILNHFMLSETVVTIIENQIYSLLAM